MTVHTVVVGCGIIAPIHLTAAREQGSVEFAGAFDADVARAEEVARRFQLSRVYASWADILADKTVDAVDLCLPHNLHHSFAIEALRAGKHVLVEKPIAPTVAQGREMVGEAEKAGRLLMPVHNRLFVPTLMRLKEIVSSGSLGDVYLIKTLGIEPPATVGVRPWLNQHHLGGGGVTMAQTVHFAYVCRWLMGDVRRVGSLRGRRMLPAMEDEDTAIILLQFASGSIGEMTSTFAQEVGGHDHRVTVYGTRGVVTANHAQLTVTSEQLYGDTQPHEETSLTTRVGPTEFAAVLNVFGRAIETGSEPEVSGMDGVLAVEIIEAAARAARDGCFIDLPIELKSQSD